MAVRAYTYLLYSSDGLFELTVEETEDCVDVILEPIPSCRGASFVYTYSHRTGTEKLDIVLPWISMDTEDGGLIEQFLDSLERLVKDSTVIAEKVWEREG